MQSKEKTVEAYLEALPEDRQAVMRAIRKILLENLPTGFVETMSYGMIGYVVPHELYPTGYHVDPSLPLPFINLASQKNYIALYHMGLYADPDMLEWFRQEFPNHTKQKLNMGKSCIRLKPNQPIPLKLIAELSRQISPAEWILRYESIQKKLT
ncbi:DUF1801 domain-containing protein [Dyadobacter tibetensis]|uniref:DUF1801 domain-containing protein n=1 Tax=Dyadobacter tibetensis TaxID=1211851 RepID=UPI00047144D0|nr:DUF1801 domain-containing protein [Dyadobacter tibetensis]